MKARKWGDQISSGKWRKIVESSAEFCLDSRANLHVDSRANLHVDRRANLHVDSRANLHVDSRANLHVDSRENLHVDSRENLHVDSRTNLHVDSRANLQINTTCQKIRFDSWTNVSPHRRPPVAYTCCVSVFSKQKQDRPNNIATDWWDLHMQIR